MPRETIMIYVTLMENVLVSDILSSQQLAKKRTEQPLVTLVSSFKNM